MMFSISCTILASCQYVTIAQDYGEWERVDVLHNRAMRYCLGVNKFAPVHALYGEMGWVMPRYGRWISMVRLWNRMISMNNDRLTKRLFLWDKPKCFNNWSSWIYEICTEFGLESNFQHELPIDISIFDSLMISRTETTWKDTIQFKPKLRTYVKYKINNYKTEDYIRTPLGRMHRPIFA